MSTNQAIRDWFANMTSVMDNLGAFKMARYAVSVGKKYNHRFISPSNNKVYNADALLKLYAGVYDTSSAADVEYRSIVVQQDNLLGLFMGLQYARMLGSNGKSFITNYQTVRVSATTGNVVSKGGKRGLNNAAVTTLYNTRSPAGTAYPLVTV